MVPVGWHRWSRARREAWRARHPEVGERARLIAADAARAPVRVPDPPRLPSRGGVLVPRRECMARVAAGESLELIAEDLARRGGRPVKPSDVRRAVRQGVAARDRMAARGVVW